MTTLMVVEDDTDIRDSISQVLEDDAFEVIVATDGREAMKILEDGFTPSVILLDLMLPNMSGEEFLRAKALDKKISQIPVILITACNPHQARPKCTDSVVIMLQKPFSLKDLLRVIHVCTDKSA